MTPDRLRELEDIQNPDCNCVECSGLRELVAEVRRLQAEVAAYRARLEIDHVYTLGSEPGELVRQEVPEGREIPDGIECRDETIRLQDEAILRLRGRVAELERLAVPLATCKFTNPMFRDLPLCPLVHPGDEASWCQGCRLAAAVRGGEAVSDKTGTPPPEAAPKFKVGDGVVWTENHNSVGRVTDIVPGGYIINWMNGYAVEFAQDKDLLPLSVTAVRGETPTPRMETCRKCGQSGPACDEFLSSYNGLCDKCQPSSPTEEGK